MRCILSLATAAVLAPAAADAQCTVVGIPGSCTLNRGITATVRNTVRLTVTQTLHAVSTPTDADFENGFSVHAGPSLDVKSNTSWQVTVRSNNGQWTGTGGARVNKPRADLSWGVSASGPWTTMTNTATVFATGTATSGFAAVIYFRINWFFALDTPGTYTINTLYTISST